MQPSTNALRRNEGVIRPNAPVKPSRVWYIPTAIGSNGGILVERSLNLSTNKMKKYQPRAAKRNKNIVHNVQRSTRRLRLIVISILLSPSSRLSCRECHTGGDLFCLLINVRPGPGRHHLSRVIRCCSFWGASFQTAFRGCVLFPLILVTQLGFATKCGRWGKISRPIKGKWMVALDCYCCATL